MVSEKEYNEIVDAYLEWEDISCSCHMNPPCSKCVNSPTPEQIEQMKEYERSNG